MNDPSEWESRVRQGDLDALGLFIERARPQLAAFVERRLGTALKRKVEADDILQEMSGEAVRQLERAPFAGDDLFGWLCQIAEHRIIDAHRRFFQSQKRDAGREVPIAPASDRSHEAGFLDWLAASLTTPSQAFSRDAREARLHEALRGLPEIQQEALRLRYVEGLSTKEIAGRIGKTDGAVRVMLTRAVKTLQELLVD